MGISKLLRVATSYCPAWLENSWLILSRTSFSGSTVKMTVIPVSFVKCSAVSRCRSIICGLLTISTLMLFAPPLPTPPPHPAQAVLDTSTTRASSAARTPVRFIAPSRDTRACSDEHSPDHRSSLWYQSRRVNALCKNGHQTAQMSGPGGGSNGGCSQGQHDARPGPSRTHRG